MPTTTITSVEVGSHSVPSVIFTGIFQVKVNLCLSILMERGYMRRYSPGFNEQITVKAVLLLMLFNLQYFYIYFDLNAISFNEQSKQSDSYTLAPDQLQPKHIFCVVNFVAKAFIGPMLLSKPKVFETTENVKLRRTFTEFIIWSLCVSMRM